MIKTVRVLVITGDGRGKTTSAFGLVLRAVGHGQSVCVVQFIKKECGSGESVALGMLPGVELHICGDGFVFNRDARGCSRHVLCAEAGMKILKQKIKAGFDMFVLDEICGAVSLGLVSVESVLALMESASENAVFVLTGRDAPPELVERADTVSRIECVKHGCDAGLPARKGVEM